MYVRCARYKHRGFVHDVLPAQVHRVVAAGQGAFVLSPTVCTCVSMIINMALFDHLGMLSRLQLLAG